MTRPAKMSRTSASPVQHQSKMSTITCSNRISMITGGDILPLPCPSIIIIANLPSKKDKRKAKKLLRSSSRNLRKSNIAEDAIKGTISMMLKIPLLQKNPKLKTARKIAEKHIQDHPSTNLVLAQFHDEPGPRSSRSSVSCGSTVSWQQNKPYFEG